MGLTDFVSKITSVYKADTTQHKAAIRELSGEQRKAAQEELKRIEAGNAGIESQIKKYGKIGIALGAVGVAGKLAFDAIEFAGRRADLAGAAGTVSIDRLRKATLGLRTDTQLLETAAKLNNTQLGLSQDQMDIAARAAQSLAERGGDAQEAFDAVTAALVSGKTKGLAPYGIAIDETKDKSEKLAEIMKALTAESDKFGESSLDGADKMAVAQNKLTNAIDEIKIGVGELAMSLTPLIEGLAVAASKTADLFNTVRTGWSGMFAMMGGRDNFLKFWGYDKNDFNGKTDGSALENYIAGGGTEAGFIASQSNRYQGSDSQTGQGGYGSKDNSLAEMLAKRDAFNKAQAAKGIVPKKSSGSRGRGVDYDELAREQADEDAAWAEMMAETQNDGYTGRLRNGQQVGAGQNPDMFDIPDTDKFEDFLSRAKEGLAEIEFMREADGPTVFERMFGSREQMDGYSEAFGALSGVASSAYSSMIDGTMSLGQAVKKSAADAIKSIGLKMLLEGAYETAMGVKMLAGVYTAGLAPGHFAAAGKFFAGAAIAGIAANALGGGGSSGGGGGRSAAPASYGSPTSAAYQGGQNVTIVYGDQFADDSPRNRQRTAQKLVGRALGTSGGTYS